MNRFDIAVVGGGVVGLAILRRLAMAGHRCILLEKGADILSGASKANSALLHTGFDAGTGSVELACMQAGYQEYLAIHESLNLPLVRSGALVVAWTEAELSALPGIVQKAHANGVLDVAPLSAKQLAAQEPGLHPGALGAVWVPGEHIIDAWSAPLAYARQALAHGARILRSTEVTGGVQDENGWCLNTTSGPTGAQGTVQATVVINAAGNFGDHLEAIVRPSPFHIRPRKGQFVVFDKPAAQLVKAIILPVPNERTKGVVLFRTAFGNLAIGPTAEDQDERQVATCDTATLERLKARALEMVPGLAGIGVNAIYAGLRPATEHKDYCLGVLPKQQWITVGGIRSTGLTASLGIAQQVSAWVHEHFFPAPQPTPEPIWTPVPNLCEERPRPYQSGGEIVCHCERVTRSEIEQALQEPLPATDMAGLKRRTRATMGRCQGFYCSAQVQACLREATHAQV
jgi:glycerol-3-phosphate dehydrogenase